MTEEGKEGLYMKRTVDTMAVMHEQSCSCPVFICA